MITVLFVLVAVILIAKVLNRYQAKWQERRDEEELIANAVAFTSAWGQSEYRADEALGAVVSEADALTEAERERSSRVMEIEDAVPDEVYISAVANRLHFDAANGLRDQGEPKRTSKLEDAKRFFRAVEESKWEKGILAMNEEGITWKDGGVPSKERRGL